MARTPPVRTAIDWLGANEAFRATSLQGARLLEFQQALDRATGGARLIAIALADGCATVAAGNASAAAKLRQSEPSLREQLAADGWPIERFRIRAEPPRWQRRAAPARLKPPIPAEGVRAVAALAQAVDDGPLKDALRRLAARHRRPE